MKLGVNIDHVATLRQARGTPYPDLPMAIGAVERGGADAITLHLREDRRHIQDADVLNIHRHVDTRVNLEMAATDEMVGIASQVRPSDCCIVPERREELTTEGGLDVVGMQTRLRDACGRLATAGIRVSLFVEPDITLLPAILATGAPVIELHTGRYANLPAGAERDDELARLRRMSTEAHAAGIQVNAGHGLDYDNVDAIAAIPELVELNIGHAIVCRALFVGLEQATHEMKALMLAARP
ncbi:pyridoxine 5'-phosphate synthase [Acidihalobacter yilgarnensis]|uniref:Pyridoxine 5'-phosphate synthase n=1 Tax=Acidihalobacter yilgarnensis TaxID=2819280 RepID=A0A1D8IM93_9GAMM|nr:pyridoxine 5'-phosphate synthase [Acidihalobacter yilgarnensis]AOU97578.1 pyridoxine 5'-phosphate synthase [Acidihalobacter yilgarnensis]